MERKNKRLLIIGVSFIVSFALWTFLISMVDIRSIGPQGTSVGFATLNECFHRLTGVNMLLYYITDWLGLVPIATALGFSILGLAQLVRRKSLLKVDPDVLALGVFYIIVISVYVFFELIVINYRPTLIDGYLEASYPSSTTMLVTCVMPTTAIQLNKRIKNIPLKRFLIITIMLFVTFMVFGRLFSGVHWITDIIGGVFFSIGIVLIYLSVHNNVQKLSDNFQ